MCVARLVAPFMKNLPGGPDFGVDVGATSYGMSLQSSEGELKKP